MALPRFFDRVADASLPLLGAPLRKDFRSALQRLALTLEAPEDPNNPALHAGWMLSANLAARLYPAIHLAGHPGQVTEAAKLITAINPACEVRERTRQPRLVLSWRGRPTATRVVIGAAGWNCVIDRPVEDRSYSAAAPAALAAAAIGAGQVFRRAFASLLGSRARLKPEAGGFNLISLKPWDDASRAIEAFELGEVHLVGAGALGQAAALTLRAVRAHGHVVAVEDQNVALSNLQRYVLTDNTSVGRHKLDVLEDSLRGSGISLSRIPYRWGLDDRARAGSAETVLVAVDTPDARIHVQAGLPSRIYNAFTGPLDIGWSRHEHFGEDPCLACLYWPTGPIPNEHEVIARDLDEEPLRILMYLLARTPVGQPLGFVQASPTLPAPPDAQRWLQTSLLDDLATRFQISETSAWERMTLFELYREGICGGGIVGLPGADQGDLHVPAAHQSTFAGIMLATQLLAASDASLARSRPSEIEARYLTLGRPSQVLPVPTAIAAGCICRDPDYRANYGRSQHQAH